MKVLQICNKSPFPPAEGGPMAMFNILDGLQKAGHIVKVFAMDTGKYPIDLSKVPEDLRKHHFYSEKIDLRIKLWPAFMNLFSRKSLHVERFISEQFRKKLEEILQKEEFDIIQLESIFTAPYIDTIRKLSKAKVILRAHNIEHLIWERITRQSKNPIKKLYLNHLSSTLKRFELSVLYQCDGIATITQQDADFFKKHSGNAPVIDIPFGIDPEKYDPLKVIDSKPSCFHIGSMNWIPNIEGMRWFLDQIWPVINERFPDLKFHIAGRHMPAWLNHMDSKNLVIHGEVADAREFMNQYSIMIVPLLSGSGIRIKIIEGMALGKVVISTSIGAEGIQASDQKHLMIADTTEAFTDAILFCHENPEKKKEIGKNARRLIEEKYNNHLITKKLIGFYQELING